MADVSLASVIDVSFQTSSFQFTVNYKNFSCNIEFTLITTEPDIIFVASDASLSSQANIVFQTGQPNIEFIGVTQELQSVCNFVFDTTCVLNIGILTQFGSNAPPITFSFNDPDFVSKADIKELASNTTISSQTSLTVTFGHIKPIDSTATFSLDTILNATIGSYEVLQSVCNLESYTGSIYLDSGKQRYFDSTSIIDSSFSCNLISYVANVDSTSCLLSLSTNDIDTWRNERFYPSPATIGLSSSLNATVGRIEYLDSTCDILTYFISELSIPGREESLSSNITIGLDSTCVTYCIPNNTQFNFSFVPIESNFGLTLTRGKIEYLDSTANINFQTNNVFADFIYDSRSYYSTTTITSKTSDDIVLISGRSEPLSSIANIQSSINLKETIGRFEELQSNVTISSITNNVNAIVGIETSLVSTANINLQTNNVDVTYTAKSIELQSICNLDSICINNITIGKIEELQSSCIIESNFITDLNVGIQTEFTSECNIKSDCNLSNLIYIGETFDFNLQITNITFDTLCNIVVGEVTPLNSITNIESQTLPFDITFGKIEELISQYTALNAVCDLHLTIGKVEELSSVVSLYTQTMGDSIVGRVEELQSKTTISGLCNLNLSIGKIEELSSDIINIVSKTNDTNFIVGRIESLSSNTKISTFANLDLTIGKQTELESVCTINSRCFSGGYVGHIESLSSTIQISSDFVANAFVGKAKTLSSIAYINSDTNKLVIKTGRIENLESQTTINLFTPDLKIKSINELFSSCNITSKFDINLQIGKIESLSSQITIDSTTSCDTLLDISLFDNVSINSNFVLHETIGRIENLESKIQISSEFNSYDLIVGRVEELSCNLCNIRSKTSIVNIIFGKIKEFESLCDIISKFDLFENLNIDVVDDRYKILILELQYWMERTLTKSEINKEFIRRTSISPNIKLKENSIIHLLFNDNYSQTDYCYLLTERQDKFSWPSYVKYKLSVYPLNSKYYQFDDYGSSNLFKIKSDDIMMLDILLNYRLHQNILLPDYHMIDTNLSKMIYIYLDLKINKNIDKFDHIEFMSGKNSILETAYECYLMNEIFTFVSGSLEQNN